MHLTFTFFSSIVSLRQLEEEDNIIVKWAQEDVKTLYSLLNNNNTVYSLFSIPSGFNADSSTIPKFDLFLRLNGVKCVFLIFCNFVYFGVP